MTSRKPDQAEDESRRPLPALLGEPPVVLRADRFSLAFRQGQGQVDAVKEVSFEVRAREITALVGESGSGKSVTAQSVLDLIPNEAIASRSGTLLLAGEDLLARNGALAKLARGRRVGMVFQDPLSALTPHLTIGRQIEETLLCHGARSKREARARALALLREVGFPDPETLTGRHPHELSGGQRQRVLIAIALSGNPELLIADEPTTALDVTVQAHILALFRRLVDERGLALLLISHDLSVVSGLADTVVVLYCGRVLEQGPTAEVLVAPGHPYTKGLLGCIPTSTHLRGMPLPAIPGAIPKPGERSLASGCVFAPRCASRQETCEREHPPLRDLGPRHSAACFADRAPDGTFSLNLRP